MEGAGGNSKANKQFDELEGAGELDDDPKMINLRVNKEESKHRVEEKPYWD